MECAFGAQDVEVVCDRDGGEQERVKISELLGKLLLLVS